MPASRPTTQQAVVAPMLSWLHAFAPTRSASLNAAAGKLAYGDPLDSQTKGITRQLERLGRIGRDLEARHFQFAVWDLRHLGKLNIFGKHVWGILDRPQSSNVLFYHRSLLREARAVLGERFAAHGLYIHAGNGTDEFEPEPSGTLEETVAQMGEIAEEFNARFNGRYAVFSLENRTLTLREIAALERMPGALVLEKSVHYVLSMDLQTDPFQPLSVEEAMHAIAKKMAGPVRIRELVVSNNDYGPFSFAIGLVGLDAIRTKLKLALWKTLSSDAAIREVYSHGMAHAEAMLHESKQSTEGPNRVAAFSRNGSHIRILFSRPGVPVQTIPADLNAKEHLKEERDHLTGLKTSTQLSEEAQKNPRDYWYLLSFSNYIGDIPVRSRAFKGLNETSGAAVADVAIQVVANRLSRRVGSEELLGRLRPDSYVIGSDHPLTAEFWRDLMNGLREEILNELQIRGLVPPANFNPHALITEMDTQDDSALPHRETSGVSALFWAGTHLTSIVEHASVNQGQLLDLTTLSRAMDIALDVSGRFHVLRYNPAKRQALYAAYQAAQSARFEEAVEFFESHYGRRGRVIDFVPPVSRFKLLLGRFLNFVFVRKITHHTNGSDRSLSHRNTSLFGRAA